MSAGERFLVVRDEESGYRQLDVAEIGDNTTNVIAM
jgi:hypothetical protein